MILRNLQNSPEKMTPVAMSMVVVGLSILAIAVAWPHFSPSLPAPIPQRNPQTNIDWNDFARGVLFGIAIALEACGVLLAATAAAKKRKPL